jgi:hypothetical protein
MDEALSAARPLSAPPVGQLDQQRHPGVAQDASAIGSDFESSMQVASIGWEPAADNRRP